MAKTPRFPTLKLEDLTGHQREVAEDILKFSLNGFGGPFNMLLRSPRALQSILTLSDYLRFHSAVPDRLVELAVLTHARIWSDEYEWSLHAGRALKAGLSDGAIEDIRQGRRPSSLKADERAVFDYCAAVARRQLVSDEAFARAKDILGEQGVVDLTITLATYVMVSMVLRVSEAPLPANAQPALPPVADPFG